MQVLEYEQGDQRRPDLNLQSVFAGADEGFDAQVLFERLEEQLSGKGLARYLRRARSVSSPSP